MELRGVPAMGLAREMDSPLNCVEPFIAVMNSSLLELITPAVYLFLVSDYPRLDKNGIFSLIRTGKAEWALGQAIFFVCTALSFLLALFLLSLVPNMANSFVADGWSLPVTQYGALFPDKASSTAANLITGELYNQIAPFEAAALAFALNLMYLVAIGMALLAFYTLNAKKLGLPVVVGVIAVGSALGIIGSPGMWAFPMAHTMVSLHYTEYFREPVMPIWHSFLYFVCAIALLFALSMASVRRTDFLDVDEGGD